MAPLETKEKMANSLGFRWFKMNPGTATNYHLLLVFLYPVVARSDSPDKYGCGKSHQIGNEKRASVALVLPNRPAVTAR